MWSSSPTCWGRGASFSVAVSIFRQCKAKKWPLLRGTRMLAAKIIFHCIEELIGIGSAEAFLSFHYNTPRGDTLYSAGVIALKLENFHSGKISARHFKSIFKFSWHFGAALAQCLSILGRCEQGPRCAADRTWRIRTRALTKYRSTNARQPKPGFLSWDFRRRMWWTARGQAEEAPAGALRETWELLTAGLLALNEAPISGLSVTEGCQE